MASAKARDEIDRQPETVLIESIWGRIREHLENERHRIYEEIKNYPTPIPACDAQFNYLLEERARIPEELKRLDTFAEEVLTRGEHIRRIEEFIAWSNYINGEVEQTIRSSLRGSADVVE